jgi:hypothetical protein
MQPCHSQFGVNMQADHVINQPCHRPAVIMDDVDWGIALRSQMMNVSVVVRKLTRAHRC